MVRNQNHVNINVCIVTGKMHKNETARRLSKMELSPEKKEEIRQKREAYIKEYLDKKQSKNVTTEEMIAELQERLVQCCIDFIKEKNVGDLERVDFCADSLQTSAEYGEWTPATDSSISGSELINENGYLVLKDFVNYC